MFRRLFGQSPYHIQVGNIPPALRRANLLITTGQYIEAAGIKHIQQGLVLLAERVQFQRLYHAGMHFEIELKARNLTAVAKQIEDYLETILPSGFVPAYGTHLKKHRLVLPTACPGCGAPLRSDEVERFDELTAECSYCGRPVWVQG